ncbi:reverse transcriptase domain, reverse transcriptase zinc-binding domain protein [Tanacetum coccineum]
MELECLCGLIAGMICVIWLIISLLGISFMRASTCPLSALPAPNISNNFQDLLEWRLPTGKVLPFSVQVVWNSIRSRGADVVWYDMVWFSNCIPCHAFNMWLILLGHLKTQDKLRPWDLSAAFSVSCPLCNSQPDSQEHLFFECGFSQQLWNHVKKFACMDNMVPMLNYIILYLSPIAQRRSTRCVIAKLVVAASAYFIWQERNWRLFKNKKRSATQVIECIMSLVRLKLLSCHFKKSKDGVMFA